MSRPFPFKQPIIVTCDPSNLFRIYVSENRTQFAWLSLLAIKNTEPDGNTLITDFFYLTHINNQIVQPVFTPQISTRTYECTLSIRLTNQVEPIICKYSPIPTDHSTDNHQDELLRYCTQLGTAQWSRLAGFENNDIYVLQLPILQFTKHLDLSTTPQTNITFTFPALNRDEDRDELMLLALSRHTCSLIDCSEFIICPSTMCNPIESSHKHCIHRFCVRFWEPTF